MAFDANARLAEGRPIVDDVAEYVAACRQLGYQNSDVPVVALYGEQDGLDLGALEADIAALRLTASAVDDVLSRQAAAIAALQNGWGGAGAGVALEFLARQQRSAGSVGTAVRDATGALTALRDELWGAVDAQVSATLDAGAAARRTPWLAAARTVATGTGDRAEASELVALEVKPYVDNVIGSQWVGAMRAASAAVQTAYDTALVRLRDLGQAVFEVPFDMGPRVPGSVPARVTTGTGGFVESARPAATAPAAVAADSAGPVGPASVPAAAPATLTAPPPVTAPPPTDPGLGMSAPASAPAIPSVPSLGGSGSPLADLLGQLGGLGESGLASADLDDEPPDVDPVDADADDDDEEDAEVADEEEDAEPDDDIEPEEEPGDAAAAEVAPPAESEGTEPLIPEPEPTPVAEPLAAPPPPLPEEPSTPEQTPCEIAADELPQVGE